MNQSRDCQVAILGSGFAGSLLGWILAQAGREVVIIDRAKHPRFAIGESSTPLADCLLAAMSDEFQLPALKPLSRWGTWRRTYPELTAGKKRGFSYFLHEPHKRFTESAEHECSLLVAASESDPVADTHWYRSDVDAWLARRAADSGAQLVEEFQVQGLQPTVGGWHIAGANFDVQCQQLVDASGAAGLLGKAIGLQSSNELSNRNGALLGHFANVRSMDDQLATERGQPFFGDDAAQHHLLKDGWLWMLRFGEYSPNQTTPLTSVGLVREAWPEGMEHEEVRHRVWQEMLDTYPTIADLLRDSPLVAPKENENPKLGWIERVPRMWTTAGVRNAVMLPSTVGVVDPLHSTGIAHALSGVRRVARILLRADSPAEIEWGNTSYAQEVVSEIKWIDQLVQLSYAALPSKPEEFPVFKAACAFYFVAAIHSERKFAATGEFSNGPLLAHDVEFQTRVSNFRQLLESHGRIRLGSRTPLSHPQLVALSEAAKQMLAPWDDVGLLSEEHKNRIARSAAPK